MEFAYLNKKRVSAFDCKTKYSVLRKQNKPVYKCKLGNDLILKRGSKRIPHFAHKYDSMCECEKWGESETDAHYYMKIWLQKFLKISDDFVEYDNIDGVRPDLLWKKKYAIEIQHSIISIREYDRRNEIYYENNLIPLWIFHLQEYNSTFKSKLKGKYGKINNSNLDLYKLRVIEKEIYDREESIFYYSFPNPKIFNIPIEKIKSRFNNNPIEPIIEYYCFKWNNGSTYFSLFKKIHLSTPDQLEFHANHRYYQSEDSFIDKNEFINFLKIRTKVYENNFKDKLKIKISHNHIISIKIESIRISKIKNLIQFPKLEKLTLKKCEITKIPNFITNFRNLKVLNLSNNKISVIEWKKLSQLSNLEILNLNSNHIESMISSGYLKQENNSKFCLELKEMNLSKNKITTLNWKCINNFSNLKFLNISANSIKSLPDFEKNHSSLEILDLKDNPLVNYSQEWDIKLMKARSNIKTIQVNYEKIFEDELQVLQQIKKKVFDFPGISKDENKTGFYLEQGHIKQLNLYNCRLSLLPQNIGNLKFLEKLIITNSRISVLPESVFFLSNLKLLILESCKLTEIPNGIKNLSKVTYLSIKNNPITYLSSEIFNLPNLEYLILTKLNIKYLPIKKIQNLLQKGVEIEIEKEKLKPWTKISGNYIFVSEYEVIKEIEDIINQKFFIKGLSEKIKMTEISLQIKNAHVISISLYNCSLKSLPEKFERLVHLETLFLNKNNFQEFPKELLKLKNLKFLSLKKNLISTLPEKLTKMNNLSKINLDSNQFQVFPDMLFLHPNIRQVSIMSNLITNIHQNYEIDDYWNKDFTLVIYDNPINEENSDDIYYFFEDLGYHYKDGTEDIIREIRKLKKKTELKKKRYFI